MTVTPAIAKAGAFVPQVWANIGLDLLKPQLRVVQRVVKDTKYSDQFNVGDILNIQVPGRFSAGRKVGTSQVAVQAPRGLSSVQVTLNTHRCVDFMVQDVTAAQASPNLMKSLMKSAIAGMARAMEQDTISAMMACPNANGVAGTDVTGQAIRNAMTGLDNRLVDSEGRFLVISPKDYSAALADAELKPYFQFQSQDALRGAKLGNIYNFETYMSQLMPATAVQRVTFTGGNNGELFKLVWNGFETSDIAFSTTPATLATNIQNALTTLADPIVMTGLATVAGAGSGPWTADITFSGAALNFLSSVFVQLEGVSGTAYSGTSAVTTTGTTTTTNLAFTEDGAIFVPRRFADIPAGAGAMFGEVTDDDPNEGTGITIRVIGQYSRADRAYTAGVDVLYGTKILRPECVQRVTT